ncbi:MAG: NADH-quinone oxidoreductase subunit M [Pseudomonadota bacterium]
MQNYILSSLISIPIFGGILILFFKEYSKTLAFLVSLIVFVLSIILLTKFDLSNPSFQFVEKFSWIDIFDIYYHVGVDGLSLPFIILSTFITLIVVIASPDPIKGNLNQYFAAFLILEGLLIGVFSALDSILFYVFFEGILIPMFLIIGLWGGNNRIYATVKFFLYTFFGSIFFLVSLIYMYTQTATFDLATLQNIKFSTQEQIFIFLGFLIAFAVKIPMWPVHTWLPDAHVEAPTGGSVILAAVLLKIGGYGLVRFNLPITPDASFMLDWVVILFSLIAIIYIAFVALAQQDMKKLIAYSSIAHMGFVTLGVFIVFRIVETTNAIEIANMSLTGAMIQMVSHGFISAALFLCVGVLYNRKHTRMIEDYGGVINVMPKFGAFFIFFALANAGLPGTSGFVGEFMIIMSVFSVSFWYAFAAGTTLVLAAAYSLWLVKRVVFGEIKIEHPEIHEFQDLNKNEFTALFLLAIAVLFFGLWPAPLAEIFELSIESIISDIFLAKLSIG